jgi:hypothetical protein
VGSVCSDAALGRSLHVLLRARVLAPGRENLFTPGAAAAE